MACQAVALAERARDEDVLLSPVKTQAVVIGKVRVRFVHEHQRLGRLRERLDFCDGH